MHFLYALEAIGGLIGVGLLMLAIGMIVFLSNPDNYR